MPSGCLADVLGGVREGMADDRDAMFERDIHQHGGIGRGCDESDAKGPVGVLPDTVDLLAQPLRTLQACADHAETTGGGDGRSEGGVGTARHRRADDRILDPEQVTESRMQHGILLARVVATVTAHNTTSGSGRR